jgi:tetratricopeptide (TPR) repeat protein
MEEQSRAALQVRVWEGESEIPTYGVGEPEKNPMFLEKRVYQGSSGRVYPYPVVEKIQNEKKLQAYRLVFLENEYLQIVILPQLGGRIYRALDKTNDYDFIYYNRVIKPALVGLTGPWISGGIEFNWPQHHRPNTFGPVTYTIKHNADGSKTVWVGEIDRMYGTKMAAGFTLYPGRAYLEIQVQLYNRTPEPQTFLWWANPAVSANEHTQSVFPPDVHAVFDHGRRDVSRFPIATGTYYKVDYSAGVDISWYKNIPVPTSYMAYHSHYDFIGGYDHARQAGMLHVANHHISPGKKLWTWGNGAFGKAWERNLTDEDGPYVELMTGVYTDNQPDFSWLQPYEEKSFKQYFMPYKAIGTVKNASVDAAINLELVEAQLAAVLQVYATSTFPGAMIELKSQSQVYVKETVTLSPTQIFAATFPLPAADQFYDLTAVVQDGHGKKLLVYQPERPQLAKLPEAANPLPMPEELSNNEALYLAGLHLEQYRHATRRPELYYQEGLRRDPRDIRINVAYGTLLLRRGLFQESEALFRAAIASITRHNANPYDSEAYYQLGLALILQGRLDEAFTALYKATWSAAWQESSYFTLAQIACTKQDYEEALELVERALIRNGRNYQARHLKMALLRKLGQREEAVRLATETTQLDSTDCAAYYERYLLYLSLGEKEQAKAEQDILTRLLGHNVHNVIALASDYSHCGLYQEAIDLLSQFHVHAEGNIYPMLHYYLGYLHEKSGHADQARSCRQAGRNADTAYCFPNSLDDLIVLESALFADLSDARALYYLGNLLYDKQRHTDAIRHWERARELDDHFVTVHRNLALAYYNVAGQPERALASLERAFACGPDDARVLYELDQLYKRLGYVHEQRLAYLQDHWQLVIERDDLYLEYVTLLNTLKQYEKALALLAERIFHPWEGGEGKVAGQYVLALVELGKRYLHEHQYEAALEKLIQALAYPENLGEGKLDGTRANHVHYYLGCVYEQRGNLAQATEHFRTATQGSGEPSEIFFYNDQPPEMILYQGLAWQKLHEVGEARRRFNKLRDYGERHLFDNVKIDYFAVSLPDFLVFEHDLQKQHEIHCYYMIGLGHLGLQNYGQARACFSRVLELDLNHQGALVHLAMC